MNLGVVVANRRSLALYLVFGLLVILVVLPTPHRSGYGWEWLSAVGVTYLILCASVALLVLVSFLLQRTQLSMNLRLGVALLIAILPHMIIAASEYFFFPGGLGFEGDPLPTIQESISVGFMFGFLVFGLWLLAFVLPELAAREAARASEAVRLRMLADHQELRARLAPHFLLNTLNAIAGLVGENPVKARSVIAALGDLLRAALDPPEEDRHLVKDEVALLRSYGEILKARYGTRVDFSWQVAPNAVDCTVPRLLIQPLVENAVMHGALKSRAPSVVTVAAHVEKEQRLVFRIENDGTLQPEDDGGHGLALVRNRLELLGDGAGLSLEQHEGRTRALVNLPLKRSSSMI